MKRTRSNILVVDDNTSDIAVLTDILKPFYETFVVQSGEEALSRAVSEPRPDLVLLDVEVPETDGYEVCRRLKENARTREIPVVLLASADEPEDEAKGFAVGAVDYIVRPFSAAKVRARVGNHLKLARVRTESEFHYKTFFANMADGVVVYDSQGLVLEANPAFLENTGYRREEIEGLSFFEIERNSVSSPWPEEEWAGCSERGRRHYESFHVRKDGSVFPVEVHVRPIGFDGRPALFAVCRDVTERKRVERELENCRERLERLVGKRADELRQKKKGVVKLDRDSKRRVGFGPLIGESEQMQRLYERLEMLTDKSSTVLITGESGTGKDLVAEALHYGGACRDKPLIRFSCSSLAKSLGGSELFGHVKGAFAGAAKDRVGSLEKVDGGTLFLDEIGDVPPAFQKSLLNVVKYKTFERAGDSRTIRFDARVVAATNRDLDELVRRGEFREDLYRFLKTVELKLPPLRSRREDIPLLIDRFLSVFNEKLNKSIREVSPEVLEKLMSRAWPGNVRELMHAVEQACVLCEGPVIDLDDLLADPRASFEFRWPTAARGPGPADESLDIVEALRRSGGNKTKAARLLGISRRTLYRKLERNRIKCFE